MNIKRLFSKARDVKLTDYLSVFPMLLGLIASPFFRKKYRDVWGICERKNEARDNGYHFFKYMTREHPEQKCIYAIDRKCNDYQKVSGLGDLVQYGSIRHWITYFTCRYLISSQAYKPNGYVCTFIERAGWFKPDHVFLQHGITKDRAEFLLASNRRAKYFIAGAEPEYRFMREEFGYPEGTIQYTGFPRFDALHGEPPLVNRIFIMPTWRKWLRFRSETHEDAGIDINTSEYISMWKQFFDSPRLKEIVEQNDLEIIFYPHPNMRGILDPKRIAPSFVNIANDENADIQDLMKSSRLLVTDYSSVFFDMLYMKRPVIFYQFDEEKYRKYHYQQGWFDYKKTDFGKSFRDPADVIEELNRIVISDFRVSTAFEEEHNRTFPYYDSLNSQRVYELLKSGLQSSV